MPKITENTSLRDEFLERLRVKYTIEREGIHVSGLIYCLRETFARKYMPLPLQLQSLFYYLDGEQRHSCLQGLVPNLQNEMEINNDGLIGTMDLFNPDPNDTVPKVIEIKSTRAKPRSELAPHYLRQGAYYCLLTNTKKFTLVTQHINHGEIIFYDIEFTDEELSDFYVDMIGGRDQLAKAYLQAKGALLLTNEGLKRSELLKIFDSLPMCRESMRWKCLSCVYHNLCYIDEPGEKKVKKK